MANKTKMPTNIEALEALLDKYGKAACWYLEQLTDSGTWPEWVEGCRGVIEMAEKAIAEMKLSGKAPIPDDLMIREVPE